jgi:hypothetical protein
MNAKTEISVVARTIKGFCEAYGVGRNMAYELINDGKLKAVKAGARTLIIEESARDWIGGLSGGNRHERHKSAKRARRQERKTRNAP